MRNNIQKNKQIRNNNQNPRTVIEQDSYTKIKDVE